MTVLAMSIPVARMELLDDVQMAASIAFSKLEGLEPVPTLFFEFDGTTAGVVEQAEMVQEIATENGASGFRWATETEQRNGSFGKPGTTPIGRASPPAPAGRALLPTPSCRSAAWPT